MLQHLQKKINTGGPANNDITKIIVQHKAIPVKIFEPQPIPSELKMGSEGFVGLPSI